jgi:extracellular elastinolytic metalloproteinase
MRNKLLVAVLLLGLVAAISGPAAAGKKKKVKPYKSETVTITAGHPAFYSTSGTLVSVTGQEFLQNCAIPSSNGVDAYVFEVPKAYQKITSTITATGTTANPAGYDLDLYLYDKTCSNVGVYNAAGTDEYGAMGKGTAFIVLHAYTGNPVDAQIALKPSK